MPRYLRGGGLVLALVASAFVAQADEGGELGSVQHVLLISVDGLHALDLSNYVHKHPDSTLAELSRHGVTYTNASTSTPSDSFPGLASLVTGGSPTTTGFWYDVTWNRAVAPQQTGNAIMGSVGGSCPGTVGAVVELDEGVDTDLTALDGGGGINPGFSAARSQRGARPSIPTSICGRTPSSRWSRLARRLHRLDGQASLLRVDQRPQRQWRDRLLRSGDQLDPGRACSLPGHSLRHRGFPHLHPARRPAELCGCYSRRRLDHQPAQHHVL